MTSFGEVRANGEERRKCRRSMTPARAGGQAQSAATYDGDAANVRSSDDDGPRERSPLVCEESVSMPRGPRPTQDHTTSAIAPIFSARPTARAIHVAFAVRNCTNFRRVQFAARPQCASSSSRRAQGCREDFTAASPGDRIPRIGSALDEDGSIASPLPVGLHAFASLRQLDGRSRLASERQLG